MTGRSDFSFWTFALLIAFTLSGQRNVVQATSMNAMNMPEPITEEEQEPQDGKPVTGGELPIEDPETGGGLLFDPDMNVKTFDCETPNERFGERKSLVVKCSELNDLIGQQGYNVDLTDPVYDEMRKYFGDNRFKIANNTAVVKPNAMCRVVKNICCEGWEDVNCDRAACPSCCQGQCSSMGVCICPQDKTGKCCDINIEDAMQAPPETTDAVLFSDSPSMMGASIATCMSLGTMTRTFDGRSYKFGHQCEYILATVAGNTYEDMESSWKVAVKTEDCRLPTTCRKTITIELPDLTIVASGQNIQIDGASLAPGSAFMRKKNGLNIQRRDDYVFLETSLGLKVKWNTGADVFVTVEQSQLNNIMGL
jgi:hypothetical protein